ncbi:hypothetical protein Bca4012_072662 [Brassica carinata]
MDGRVIHVSKDVAEILARASGSGNLLSQQDKTKDPSSIDMIGLPSIDGLYEYGNRPYDHIARRRFHWERRDEYDIYGDEHGNARVVDGRIIHVSREDIREIMERAAMDGHTHICLPKYAEKFTKTMSDPEPDTYSRADIDDMSRPKRGEPGRDHAGRHMTSRAWITPVAIWRSELSRSRSPYGDPGLHGAGRHMAIRLAQIRSPYGDPGMHEAGRHMETRALTEPVVIWRLGLSRIRSPYGDPGSHLAGRHLATRAHT